jgi:hypothetical protein
VRVLNLPLIALAVALAGCYNPPIDDCQFTCPDNHCPGDMTCMAGVCRIHGASGSCPCPDPPAGCSLTTNTAGACLAACSAAQMWAAARMACAATPPWHLAVLDTSSTLSAGENALRTATTWVGLTRGSPVDDWAWITGGATVSPLAPDWTSDTGHSGAASMCAAVSGGKLYSDACNTAHAYACTPN